MACRLASVPVLTVSVLKRLQDLGTRKWPAKGTYPVHRGSWSYCV